jgi:hypothetical protein
MSDAGLCKKQGHCAIVFKSLLPNIYNTLTNRFEPLKDHCTKKCNSWLMANKRRQIIRLLFGVLLRTEWGKAAANGNAAL